MAKRKQKNKAIGGKAASASASSDQPTSDEKRPAGAPITSFPPHLIEACKPRNAGPYSTPPPEVIALHPGSVYLSRNFLSSSECRTWIQCAESTIGFEQVCHPATRYIAHRECGRIQLDDTAVSDALYERMKPIIDEVAKNVGVTHFDSTYKPVALNHNIRLYKYERGMSFGRHFDGSNEISRYENGNTEITVLIYLSTCRGGATRFYPPIPSSSSGNKKKQKKGGGGGNENDEKEGIAYVPEEGSVLLHVHGDRCLEHEADPVLDGVKYVLRTDIVYASKGNK